MGVTIATWIAFSLLGLSAFADHPNRDRILASPHPLNASHF